jgi:nitrate/nitrite transport system permease protein
MKKESLFPYDWLVLPIIGLCVILFLWVLLSQTVSPKLPNPIKTWENSKLYVLEPFAVRGPQDQGILNLVGLSLLTVAKGFLIAIVVGVPLGFFLGLSTVFSKTFDPIFQILRPVSPLAWLPLGLVIFQKTGSAAGSWGALFTIALCAMWPTVLNTAVGVRAIPQDYLNVARVLKLSRWKTLWKILLPATLPYMFTGFRLSLGIAWLVIVAAEMIATMPGIGSFLFDQYAILNYSGIIVSIIVIGVVGFILDKGMGLVEAQFKTA